MANVAKNGRRNGRSGWSVGGGALPVVAAVNLGLWMMIERYGLAFGDWVGGLPVTVQVRQKGLPNSCWTPARMKLCSSGMNGRRTVPVWIPYG